MTYELTWGLLIIAIGVAAAIYGITTAQTFYYYRTYDQDRDPLYTRILTGSIWALNTLQLGLIIHIPWYYLVEGTGGSNDLKIVWSWPASIIVNNLIALPVFTFYARRIRLLSGQVWLSLPVLCIGIVHFTCGMIFSAKLLASGNVEVLASPVTLGIAYTAFAAGTTTDVGIAVIMCWLLARSRTGHAQSDGVVSAIMIYTVNSGMMTAICVVAGLISNLVAPATQFELFFVSILPGLYANAYLGSLNHRGAIQAQLVHRAHGSADHSYRLGDLKSPPVIPGTIVHIKRQTQERKDSLSINFDHFEEAPEIGIKGV